MKRNRFYPYLPLAVALMGGAGCALRMALYTLEESSGLLPQNHPLHIAAVIFSALVALAVTLAVLPLDGSSKYRLNFPASSIAGFGALAAGIFMMPNALAILGQATNPLSLVWALLAFLCAPCMMITGICRLKGRRPYFLLHAAICLYFAIHMVCQYRIWSGTPQVETHLIPLLACVFLALTGYYRTAFDVNMAVRRQLLLCGLPAGFFCISSLGGNGNKWFYLAGGFWSLTCLCVILPPKTQEVTEDVSA